MPVIWHTEPKTKTYNQYISGMEKEIFGRTELLLGEHSLKEIVSRKVILFGVGGVGSWCAESLIRSGISYLTIVDSDRIAESNINRQLPATSKTVGQVKVEVLKKRLLEINPDAEIDARQEVYSRETSASFQLEKYDYIIDAIDSLTNKADLILSATKTDAVLFSSMGAALKMDASRIKTTEFWKVQGCPLAAALRRKFKKNEKPSRKFLCVFSDELLRNRGEDIEESGYIPINESDDVNYELRSKKVKVNGTIAHITAIFGFTLAGLVIRDICNKSDTW